MTAEWGPACGTCGCAQLVHRGAKHDGNCAAIVCSETVDRGWSFASKCAGYSAPAGSMVDPPESPDDDGPPIPDDDTPYERAREGA